MTPDPKWLAILKASGWQTTALAAASGLFLLWVHWGWISPGAPWVLPLVAFSFLVCFFLSLASIGSAALKFFRPEVWFLHWVNRRRGRRAVKDYIPHMTERERSIIAYLLAHNQKMIVADASGGYANTLLSRGILVRALQPGQVFYQNDTPMTVPDHIWTVLVEHRAEFPYQEPEEYEREPYPWRVPWGA
jgi:hypothetical protein